MVNAPAGRYNGVMHVLLDARPILAAKTGDRSYWLGLCRALPAAWPEWRFTVALDGAPEPGLLPDLPNLSVAVEPRPGGRLWPVVALPRLARRLRVDLVHLQYVAPPYLPCPFVTTVHDVSFALFPHYFTWRDGTWLRTLVPPSARRAAAVVADSETTRADLLRLWRLVPDRVRTLSLGLDAAYRPDAEQASAARAKWALPERYLLSVGVLQPRKNLAGLVAAYGRSRAEHGLTEPLVVVGKTGWLAQPIFDRVADLGLTDHVRFLGYVPDDDLPGLYGGALFTLYPSLYEGFGLPPLESLACGTPVIVSTTPALAETAGPVAPMLPPEDTAAWAAAMARLAGDEAERARLAETGLAWAAAFTWERSARQHGEVYRAALGRA